MRSTITLSRLSWLAVVAGLVAVAPTSSQGPTVVPGGAVSGQTWTANGSPYVVKGSISVSHLTIQPGVTVQMAPGTSITVNTWISARGTAASPIVFTSSSATTTWSKVVIMNLPVQSNHQYEHCVFERAQAGGIQITKSGAPKFVNCTIRDCANPTGPGGGMSIVDPAGRFRLEACRFEGNQALLKGGGLYADLGASGSIELTASVFHGNTANKSAGSKNPYSDHTGGGGVYISGPSSLERCAFTENVVHSRGYSGIWCNGTPRPSGSGGGAFLVGATTVVACRFVGNSLHVTSRHCYNSNTYPATHGAGLYVENGSGSSKYENCIVARNRANAYADSGAGRVASRDHCSGVYIKAGTHTFVNCTVARNSTNRPALDSRGVFAQLATIEFRNSILYWNKGAQLSSVNPIVTYSCVENGYAGPTNISSPPGFVAATSEIVNAFSFCVDAGDPSPAFNDKRLITMVPYGPGAQTARNDMGAHGGPKNDLWVRTADIRLAISPNKVQVNNAAAFEFTATDGNPRFPMILFYVDAGNNYWPILGSQFGSDRNFEVDTPSLAPTTKGVFVFRVFSLTPDQKLVQSNDAKITVD